MAGKQLRRERQKRRKKKLWTEQYSLFVCKQSLKMLNMKYEMNLNGKAVEQSKVINSISYHENKGVSPKMPVVKKSWKKEAQN